MRRTDNTPTVVIRMTYSGRSKELIGPSLWFGKFHGFTLVHRRVRPRPVPDTVVVINGRGVGTPVCPVHAEVAGRLLWQGHRRLFVEVVKPFTEPAEWGPLGVEALRPLHAGVPRRTPKAPRSRWHRDTSPARKGATRVREYTTLLTVNLLGSVEVKGRPRVTSLTIPG